MGLSGCWALPRRKWNGEVSGLRRVEKTLGSCKDILVDGSWIRPRVEVLPWRWRSCFRQRKRKEQAPSPDLANPI